MRTGLAKDGHQRRADDRVPAFLVTLFYETCQCAQSTFAEPFGDFAQLADELDREFGSTTFQG